jgi:hypothetical protein
MAGKLRETKSNKGEEEEREEQRCRQCGQLSYLEMVRGREMQMQQQQAALMSLGRRHDCLYGKWKRRNSTTTGSS